MSFLGQRRRQPERMDRPDLPAAQHQHALNGLARLNFLSRSAGILWPELRALGQERRSLRLLDVASGAGDLPIRLGQKARRSGFSWQIAGCDVSPQAVEFARARAARHQVDVTFFVHDALSGAPLPPSDAITCSLFLHHLDESQAVTLLRTLARPDEDEGPRLVLINDLDRSLTGLVLAHVASRLFTTSPVVHYDAARSVEGAFTLPEVQNLAEQAGLTGRGHRLTLQRRWPCRWLLTWRRA